MSIEKNVSVMTSSQVKKKLNSIQTDKLDIKHSLLNFIEQFQCLDRIAGSTGLVKDGFSFINRVSWNTVLSKLAATGNSDNESNDINLQDINDTVSLSSNQLKNELIPKLQRLRNNWMLEVILIEFVLYGVITVMVAGGAHVMGLWNLSNVSFSIEPLLYERPIFSLLVGTLLLVSSISIHFNIRNFVAAQVVKKLNKETSEFDVANAFLKNTRVQHSIFRPDIIGWNWLSRKCLLKSKLIES